MSEARKTVSPPKDAMLSLCLCGAQDWHVYAFSDGRIWAVVCSNCSTGAMLDEHGRIDIRRCTDEGSA